jgi:hypothetical protein
MWHSWRARQRLVCRAQATAVSALLRLFQTGVIVLPCGSAIGLPSNKSVKRTPVHRLRFVQTPRCRRRLPRALERT